MIFKRKKNRHHEREKVDEGIAIKPIVRKREKSKIEEIDAETIAKALKKMMEED